MFYAEEASNNDYMLYRIKDNVKGNLEYYYHANMIIMVFAMGAFALYISTRVSRGIFLFLDLFLIYKATKKLFKTRKMMKNLDDISSNLKYIKSLLIFDTILLVEATIRYFLELNIAILDYLWIAAIAYSVVLVGYKLIKSFNKKRFYAAIKENRYEDIILLKRKKEKIFTVATLFLVVFLILIRLLNIIYGSGFIALMTFVYTTILFFNIDISSEVSIEYGLLVNGDINKIKREIPIVDYEEKEEELHNEIYDDRNNTENAGNIDRTIAYNPYELNHDEELERTASFNYGDEVGKLQECEKKEQPIRSRVERNKSSKTSFINSLENIEYGKVFDKVKQTKDTNQGFSEKGKNIKGNIEKKLKLIRKIIDRDN